MSDICYMCCLCKYYDECNKDWIVYCTLSHCIDDCPCEYFHCHKFEGEDFSDLVESGGEGSP